MNSYDADAAGTDIDAGGPLAPVMYAAPIIRPCSIKPLGKRWIGRRSYGLNVRRWCFRRAATG